MKSMGMSLMCAKVEVTDWIVVECRDITGMNGVQGEGLMVSLMEPWLQVFHHLDELHPALQIQ